MSPKTWGPIIWTLIHSLTYNINTDDSSRIRELYYVISNMISSVPCPACSEHGVSIMKKIQINDINTKTDLVNVMIYIHNRVNAKLSKPQFDPKPAENKYRNSNLLLYIREYKNIMTHRVYNRNMTHGWGMSRCIKRFLSYMANNKGLFDIT